MPLPPSGELEALIMERMWSYGCPVDARRVFEDLAQVRDVECDTVATRMDLLQREGWLASEPAGDSRLYTVVAARESYVARLVREILAGPAHTAAAFVHSWPLPDAK
ncbi:BlaI/MecI/CopY family transcriptional regulator [Actinomadura sp. 6N118]|uniref:BlaI/MecI/CopY family transcriptional regulator n=1 Tax=Actinomadura sp. 6N118 TaxID=3375151 RepID=UPI00379B1561